MSTHISLHRVEKIGVTISHFPDVGTPSGEFWTLDIVTTNNEGHRSTVQLFSRDLQALRINTHDVVDAQHLALAAATEPTIDEIVGRYSL